jgi:hypothetical protein
MRRAASVAAALVALALVLAWTGGCVSTKLPAAAPDSVSTPPLELSVGVEADRIQPFSDELVHSLRAAGIFERVDRLDRLSSTPDLVARIEHGWQGAAVIPFFTVLSLGLVPTIVDETYGLAFSLHAPAAPERRVVIDTRWTGKLWLGFAAAVLNVSPGRTSDDWRTHPRWPAHLRRSLGVHSAEIELLAR